MNVFLSASIPDPQRDPKYFDTADTIAIRESVLALTAVVLPDGSLTFGGHPAITPLVARVASALQRVEQVRVFQSSYFADVAAEDVQALGVRWIPATSDRASSLQQMRTEMIEGGPYSAGIFIGGMEGVEIEFDLFTRRWPSTPWFAMGSTGAAARTILHRRPHPEQDALMTEHTYVSLFQRLLEI